MNKIELQIILEILRRENIISPASFDDGEEYLKDDKDPIEIFLNEGTISKSDIYNAYDIYYKSPYVDLDMIEISEELSSLFGVELYTKYHFIPLYRFNDGLTLIGAVDPSSPHMLSILDSTLEEGYQILSVAQKKLDAYLNIFKASEATKTALKSIQIDEKKDNDKKDLTSDVGNSPAVRFIDSILEEAVKINASDIHIEPNETNVVVRYRIDGDLHEQSTFDISFFPAISTRIKILADIDIAEKRIPQDGHISQMINGEKYDFRVSTLPTIHGEKFVIRVLDKKIFSLSLSELNFDQHVNETIDKILKHPHGIILLTGPTGSGKTTTLYSFLRELNKSTVNIITVEDPVEYSMEGINQIQVNTKADLTFATSLRSILRQDPDIIMVGEIRDEETAQIAIRAAITGHLVLSTLHTNDAPGAVTRLIDMGIPSYLVSDALVAVISQRLVKRLCPHCKKPVQPTPAQRRSLSLRPEARIYEKNGCPYCNGTGYKGRLAVHEVMYLNDELKSTIIKPDVTVDEIKDVAVNKAGMIPLINAAKKYVIKGETSYQDLMSLLIEEER